MYNPLVLNHGLHDLRDTLAKATTVPSENHHLVIRDINMYNTL